MVTVLLVKVDGKIALIQVFFGRGGSRDTCSYSEETTMFVRDGSTQISLYPLL